MSGLTTSEENLTPFIGEHPPLSATFTIASGTAERTLLAGTVLGTITTSGYLTELAPSATNGSDEATHILAEDCTIPSSGNAKATCYTHCEALDNGLTWPSSITDAQKVTAIGELRDVGIYVVLGLPA